MHVFKERGEVWIPNCGLRRKCGSDFKTKWEGGKARGADSWVRMMFLKKDVCREPADPLLLQVAALMTPFSAGRGL